MNKLYCIRFVIRGCVMYRNFWRENAAREAICEAIGYGWKVELVENNDVHKIWEAR